MPKTPTNRARLLYGRPLSDDDLANWRYSVKQKRKEVVFPHVRFETRTEAMIGAFDWIERWGS